MATAPEQMLYTPRTLFSKNERQMEAWTATLRKRFVLYGGAAGGGKSFFLRWWCVFYLIDLHEQGVDGAQVMLACEDYPSLLDRQISKIRYEFPRGLGELKESTTRDFVLNPELGGGRILLRNLDDPAKYLSAEFAGIAVDELTRNKQTVFDFLRSRLRWPGVYRPRFVAGTNPSGIGHGWVKSLWVENPPRFPKELEALRDEFAFVPAKSSDNPYLSDQYHADLETLPPDMAKAYAEGSWDVFAGQYFDIFKAETMVEREETWNIREWWPRWISVDWGFEHPSSCHWHTLGDDRVTRTYRELHKSRLGPRALAQQIVDLSRGTENPEHIDAVYLSPDAFAHRTDEQSIAEQIGDVLANGGLPRPTPADNDRIGGWMLMYQMLQSGSWKIGSGCKELIRFLPMAVRDPNKVEDIAKFDAVNGIGGDDAGDSARYGLKSKHLPNRKPLPIRVLERIESVQQARLDVGLPVQTDRTAIAMMSRKAEYEESRKEKLVPLISPRWQKMRRR